jgi:hypothetical protein
MRASLESALKNKGFPNSNLIMPEGITTNKTKIYPTYPRNF